MFPFFFLPGNPIKDISYMIHFTYICCCRNDSRNTGYDDVYATQFHVGSSATIIETPKQIVSFLHLATLAIYIYIYGKH